MHLYAFADAPVNISVFLIDYKFIQSHLDALASRRGRRCGAFRLLNIYSESLTINSNLPMKQRKEIFRARLRQGRDCPNCVCETNNVLTLKTREKQ